MIVLKITARCDENGCDSELIWEKRIEVSDCHRAVCPASLVDEYDYQLKKAIASTRPVASCEKSGWQFGMRDLCPTHAKEE